MLAGGGAGDGGGHMIMHLIDRFALEGKALPDAGATHAFKPLRRPILPFSHALSLEKQPQCCCNRQHKPPPCWHTLKLPLQLHS